VHVGALEIASKDLLKVVPTIDGVSQKMVQPGHGRFSQIYREELDNEQIIDCPSRSTREAIILQPDAGVGFAVVFDDVARFSKASWKMSIALSASEYLRTRPFRTKAASVAIILAPAIWVPHTWLGLCTIIPWVTWPICLGFRLSTQPTWADVGREAFR
jgi:hypothetical protein